MCFSSAIVVLKVIQQLLSCSILIQKEMEDRGTKDLLQPTLLLFGRPASLDILARLRLMGAKPSQSSRTYYQQCPDDLYAAT